MTVSTSMPTTIVGENCESTIRLRGSVPPPPCFGSFAIRRHRVTGRVRKPSLAGLYALFQAVSSHSDFAGDDRDWQLKSCGAVPERCRESSVLPRRDLIIEPQVGYRIVMRMPAGRPRPPERDGGRSAASPPRASLRPPHGCGLGLLVPMRIWHDAKVIRSIHASRKVVPILRCRA